MITWVTAGDVFARRLDANGDPVGGVITVANQAGDQEDAKVAVSSGGAFAVVYVDAAGEEDVLMRRFEANGDPAGGVVNVAVRDGVQWTPNVAVHADGSFTVVYADEGDEEIFARRYEAGGNPIGAEITVFEGGPVNPDVVAVPGGFTVAFDEDGEVYSLGFDSAGNPRTDRERVNQNAGGLQNAPVADTAPDGRLVVAFNSSAGDRGALRQIRPDDLQAVGDDIPVSESGPAGAPIPGGIAADADGFVVVWEADDAEFRRRVRAPFQLGLRAAPHRHPHRDARADREPGRHRGPAGDGHPRRHRDPEAPDVRAAEVRRGGPPPVDQEVREPPQVPDPPARARRDRHQARDRQGQRQARRDPQGQARHRARRPPRAPEGPLQGRDPGHDDDRQGHQGHAQVPHLRAGQEEAEVAAPTLTQLCQGCATLASTMDGLTIHEAAETTGWSPRMLRYVERVGLVEPARSASGYRLYGPAELQRLRTLRELLSEHDIGLSDVAFARRLRQEADLRNDTEGWLEAQPERPDDVSPSDWLSFEQQKHQRLLAAVAATS